MRLLERPEYTCIKFYFYSYAYWIILGVSKSGQAENRAPSIWCIGELPPTPHLFNTDDDKWKAAVLSNLKYLSCFV